jgi:hypothetical protein
MQLVHIHFAHCVLFAFSYSFPQVKWLIMREIEAVRFSPQYCAAIKVSVGEGLYKWSLLFLDFQRRKQTERGPMDIENSPS